MRRTEGFALLVSLVILMVVGALGVGALFLTQMNLRIAENTRTQAIARYNAEAGLDTSFVLLARAYKENGTLPTNLNEFQAMFPSFNTQDYVLAGYAPFADGSVQVRVRGLGPRNSQYESEALIEALVTPSPGPSGYTLFGEGFVARSHIDLSGTGSFDINFWSGGDVNLRSGNLVEGRSARAAGSTCRFGAPPQHCETGVVPPPVVDPDFEALRAEVIENAETDNPGFDMAICPMVTGLYNGSHTVVCVPSGQTLTLTGNVRNLVVIGDETTTVHIDASTGDPTTDDVDGVTVVSGTVTFGGNAAFHGTNTIIAKNDIEFSKNVVSHDGVARTFIVTEGNFALKGTGASDIYASFWVGGTFDVKGTPNTFRGTVVAGSTIFRAGGGSFHTIRPPTSLDNRYIPTTEEPSETGAGIRLISRR